MRSLMPAHAPIDSGPLQTASIDRSGTPSSASDEGAARRATRSALATLPDDYRVLHDVEITAFHAGVDHVVVGPTGIFAIVFVHRDDRLRVVERSSRRRSRNDIGKECEAARWKAGAVGSVLQHAVVPIVCVVDSALRLATVHVGHVVVCRVSALAQYIVDGPHCLDDTAIRFFGDRSAVHAGHTTRRSLAISTPSHLVRPGRAGASRPTRLRQTGGSTARRGVGWRLLSIAAAIVVFVLALQVVSIVSNYFSKTDNPRAHGTATSVAISPVATTTSRPFSSTAPQPAQSVPAGASLPSTPASAVDDTLPPDPNAPTTVQPTVAAPSTVASSIPGSELLPSLSFACPSAGAGWSASAIATEFKADPVGYFLWYQVGQGPWTFWGQFKSGSAAPLPIGPIASGTDVNVRMDRTLHADSESAPTMLTFTSPSNQC